MQLTRRQLLACASATLLTPAAFARPKQPYTSSALGLVMKANAKSRTHSYFLVVSSFERYFLGRRRASLTGYLVSIGTPQLVAAANSALQTLSVGVNVDPDAVRARIRAAIERNVSGAMMQELRPEQLTRLLGEQGFRTGNTSLAAEGDFIGGVLTAGGAFAGVAGSSAASTSVAAIATAGGAAAGGAGIAAASAGYGAYQVAGAFLDAVGANDGYTLGDLIYDLLHPGEEGNRVWSSDSSSQGPASGTTLPPGFGPESDPGRNIVFQIVMGLATNSSLGRNVIARPPTLASTPIPGADGVTNLALLLRFDAMLGGAYFKLVQRSLNARQNGTATTDPDITQGTANGPIMVDYSKCPPADVNAMRLSAYLASASGALTRIAAR
ncbi:MAG: hypothetical protein R3E77_15240 [Steroidobacteraceae bacterium]